MTVNQDMDPLNKLETHGQRGKLVSTGLSHKVSAVFPTCLDPATQKHEVASPCFLFLKPRVVSS